MEENVALDSAKQKKFDKSIKGIKKLIKKKDTESKSKDDGGEKVKTGRISKKKRKERGLVYLGHIPHGFYENEMSQYFKQFGVVTNVRVIKSKRTGRSKGYAFVEFQNTSVAQIVAETMNNYLMGKRLIKAAYIPPEKQKRKVFRRRWNAVNNPGNNLRIKMKKAHNKDQDEAGELQRARKLLKNINKTKKKLAELGINYDFFIPVDVPEALARKVEIKTENEDSKENTAVKNIKAKKDKKIQQQNLDVKKENSKDSKTKTKSSENVKVEKEQDKTTKIKKDKNKSSGKVKLDKDTQKQKKLTLKDKGVTPLEDFIKIDKESGDDSDSSLEFDSDEYEKMLEDDDNVDSDMAEEDSGDESVNEEDDGTDAESDESEEEILLQQNQKNKTPKAVPVKQLKQNSVKQLAQKRQQPQVQQPKRMAQKAPAPAASKKPKFEKQSNQKAKNKQFKKKK